jgi:hypothetical protein
LIQVKTNPASIFLGTYNAKAGEKIEAYQMCLLVSKNIMIYSGFKKTIFVSRMTELIVLIFVSDFFHVPHIKVLE